MDSKNFKDALETRLQDEISNFIVKRMATKKCNNCGRLFWIDRFYGATGTMFLSLAYPYCSRAPPPSKW
ncbi:hypothetical protein MUP77_17930 [Candidatus Bathyarchaeota archaeon]|nr:hypothetical protein [Candidatus Bathyarchaeota archaeon]